MTDHTFDDRFGGSRRLYGSAAVDTLRNSHVCIVGIGGVGSWAAEAIARTGVGTITLIDLDDICATNTNRQIHALEGNFGRVKVDAMAERIRAINPDCDVIALDDRLTPATVERLITKDMDCVLDAIDSAKDKAAIIAHCKYHKIKIVTVGGAGGQIDPLKITSGDLAKTIQDPLSAKVRSHLRRFHNFSKNPKSRFGVECVYSTEQPRYPTGDGEVCQSKVGFDGHTRLDCATGFGAGVTVTAAFGMVAAARVINKLTR